MDELQAVATQLGRVTGSLVVFGAATGLRPAELVALERRDVDRAGGVVYVRRQLVRGQIKHTKTRRSVRAVPLQALALEALEQLPGSDGPPLFPAARGGYIDLHNFRAREWQAAQIAAGIRSQCRRLERAGGARSVVRRTLERRHRPSRAALRHPPRPLDDENLH